MAVQSCSGAASLDAKSNHKKADIQSENDAFILHSAFVLTAAITIITSSPTNLGIRIWSLIIGWYTSIIVVAIRANHTQWLEILRFLFPLCICFIFPDGYLTLGLKTIHFPDLGVGQIYGVTSFMPFMWAIPLFVSIIVGMGMLDRGVTVGKAAICAGFMGLFQMGGSELLILTRIPLWTALNNKCTMIGDHMAVYVILPEFCLGICTFLGWEYIRSQKRRGAQPSLLEHVFVVFMIMCMYLGNLIVCFMILHGDKLLS